MKFLYECPVCGHQKESDSPVVTTVICEVCVEDRGKWIAMICVGESPNLDNLEEGDGKT